MMMMMMMEDDRDDDDHDDGPGFFPRGYRSYLRPSCGRYPLGLGCGACLWPVVENEMTT